MSDTSKSSFIAKGTIIKGNLKLNEALRIDGKILGDITSSNKVIIGTSGEVEGNITAKELESSGHLKIEKIEIDNLILSKDSNINGEIIVKKLQVEPGARINGNISMSM